MQRLFQRWFSKSPPVVAALFVAALAWHARATPDDVVEVEEFDADAQQVKLAAISTSGVAGNAETLRNFLRDPDPVVGAAAFNALTARGKLAAVQALLAVINDTTEPVRLQALQMLVDAPDMDDATVLGALRSALEDPDSALVVYAVQVLMARNDPAAVGALTDALRQGSAATRLLIVKTVGTAEAAQRYLYDALRDPDENVRGAAEEALNPSKNDEDPEP